MSSGFNGHKYVALLDAKRHDEAIDYCDSHLAENPDDPRLKRFAALARGAKGEHALGAFDGVAVVPSTQRIDELIALFNEAISIDPTLADPYWDLAVIHGRFRKDPVSARSYLVEAKQLGYQHPMMSELEKLLASLESLIANSG